MSKTPVVFLVFNRPQQTSRVFEAIAAARPERLLVVADGPRTEAEAEACRQVREIATAVTWPCEVETQFSEVNLGCRKRVASGLDWVFQRCEEAIILEDDTLPSPSFFPFCEELLNRYRSDERVLTIGGINVMGDRRQSPFSYRFSRYFHCWGWATWRRSWRLYDIEMKSWPENPGLLSKVFRSRAEALYFDKLFAAAHAGAIDTWDYQLMYAGFLHNRWSIFPSVNLVTNIGFGAGATHTADASCWFANHPVEEIMPLVHPTKVIQDSRHDARIFNEFLGGAAFRRHHSRVHQTVRSLHRGLARVKNRFLSAFRFKSEL